MFIEYEFVNEEPVKIADIYLSKEGQTAICNYVPGSSIRGSIVSLLAAGESFEEQKKILLSEKTCFYNAYPMIWQEKEYLTAIPTPKGFYENKKQDGNLENRVAKKEENEIIPGNKRAAVGMFARISGETLQYMSVEKGEALNVNIEEQNVFRSDSICSGYHFKGYIRVSDKKTADLLIDLLNTGDFRFGSNRSAGYGKVKMISVKYMEDGKRPYEEFSVNGQTGSPIYLVAVSPFAMRGENGELCGINEKILEEKLGITGLTIEKASTSVVKKSGFNRTWGMRTPQQSMYEAGSVFKIKFDGEISAEKVREIEENGLGINKNEGCGRVLILKDYDKISKKEKVESRLTGTQEAKKKELTEDDKKVLEIAAQGMLIHKIDRAMNHYVVEHPLKLGSASRSQAGMVLAMCKEKRYNLYRTIDNRMLDSEKEQMEKNIKKHFEKYFSHILKKEESRRTHDGAGSQKQIIKKFQTILDNNLFDTLGIAETECCGVPVEKILSVKQKYIYKIKLIEEMIQYRNRLDKNGNNPERSGEEEE